MAQPGQGGRQPSSWPIGRRDGCETPSVDRARHERRSPRFSCAELGWVLDGAHDHPAVGDPQKQAVLAAWDPRLCLQAKEKGSDTDMNGAGERWSSASRMVMGRWLLGTLHGYREGVVKKNVISDHSFQWTCFQRGSTATVRAGIANQTTQGPFADFQLLFPCPDVRENLPPHEQCVEIHPQGGLADYCTPICNSNVLLGLRGKLPSPKTPSPSLRCFCFLIPSTVAPPNASPSCVFEAVYNYNHFVRPLRRLWQRLHNHGIPRRPFVLQLGGLQHTVVRRAKRTSGL